MTETSSLFATRELTEADYPFVVSTWVHQLAIPHWMGRKRYLSEQRKAVNAILERSRGALVLCSPTTPSAIFAWVCADDGVVFGAYARPEMLRDARGRSAFDELVASARGTTEWQQTG